MLAKDIIRRDESGLYLRDAMCHLVVPYLKVTLSSKTFTAYMKFVLMAILGPTSRVISEKEVRVRRQKRSRNE